MSFLNNFPLISVVLSTYNGEEFLNDQIDSILTQTYENIELLISDDQSTDRTLNILRVKAAEDKRITIYSNELNEGINSSLEKLMTKVNGEFIAVADQDDIWMPDKIMKQYVFLQNSDAVLVYHDSQFVDSVGNTLNKKMSDHLRFYSGSNPLVFIFDNCISGHSILFKRILVEIILPFPNEFLYDKWIAFMATNIGKVAFIETCLVKYRRHSNNQTGFQGKAKGIKSTTSTDRDDTDLLWMKYCLKVVDPYYRKKLSKMLSLAQRVRSKGLSFRYFIHLFYNYNTYCSIRKKSTLSNVWFLFKKGFRLRNIDTKVISLIDEK